MNIFTLLSSAEGTIILGAAPVDLGLATNKVVLEYGQEIPIGRKAGDGAFELLMRLENLDRGTNQIHGSWRKGKRPRC